MEPLSEGTGESDENQEQLGRQNQQQQDQQQLDQQQLDQQQDQQQDQHQQNQPPSSSRQSLKWGVSVSQVSLRSASSRAMADADGSCDDGHRSFRKKTTSTSTSTSFDCARSRESQNLDQVLERLHSDLGTLRLHGFRSLQTTAQSSHTNEQQQQQQPMQSSVYSCRSSREDSALMENIAELDSLLDMQPLSAATWGDRRRRKKQQEQQQQKRHSTCIESQADGSDMDELPVFSQADFRDASGGGGGGGGAPETMSRGAKFRWSSFARCHRPGVQVREAQIAGMAAAQMQALRSGAFLELNRIVRQHCPASKSLLSWFLPKLFKRQKSTNSSAGGGGSGGTGDASNATAAAAAKTAVFGVPLATVQMRCGQPLPSGVIHLMRQLRHCGVSAHGIFRRAGGRARVNALKSQLDDDPDRSDFSQCLPYDLADLVKTYLRELPECLMTQKLSPTLMDIFTYVTSDDTRLLAMQSVMLLLPDENREVLQALLYFLNDFADCADTTQMGASNLAVCLVPSLFYFPHEAEVDFGSASTGGGGGGNRARRFRRLTGVPDPRNLADHRSATTCLTFMIDNCHQLFLVPGEMHERLTEAQDDVIARACQPPSLDSVAPKDTNGKRHCFTFADNHAQLVARECGGHGDPGKWQQFSHRCGVQTFHKAVNDQHPLRLWKAIVTIEAQPIAVLNKIVTNREKWDPDILSTHLVESMDENSDVIRVGIASPPAQPAREACLLRAWRTDSSASHRVHSTSVRLPAPYMTLQVHVLTEDWLIEQHKPDSCRVTLLSRVDLHGHSIDWYNKTWGHSIARQLVHLKKSFAAASAS